MPHAVAGAGAPRVVTAVPVEPVRLPSGWRRRALWSALTLLVVALLVTLVWLAGRYEASQVQSRLERDAAEAVGDIRAAFTRTVQSLQDRKSVV